MYHEHLQKGGKKKKKSFYICKAEIKPYCLEDLKHVYLLLQTEKVELETTVVGETKEHEAHAGPVNGRLSGQ